MDKELLKSFNKKMKEVVGNRIGWLQVIAHNYNGTMVPQIIWLGNVTGWYYRIYLDAGAPYFDAYDLNDVLEWMDADWDEFEDSETFDYYGTHAISHKKITRMEAEYAITKDGVVCKVLLELEDGFKLEVCDYGGKKLQTFQVTEAK